MKKRITALFIMTFIILVPFQMAFRNIDNENPIFALLAFLSVMVGIGISITLFESSKSNG
jgi:hypothetical protein